MSYENFILFIQATIIVVETTVLIFLIYHIRELHKRTKIVQTEIKTINEAVSELHSCNHELHEGTSLAHKQIDTMKKILKELHEFSIGKQLK